ncbi:anti-sigma factor [Ensifer adhaerens]|uniref:anti-sigma factor family protein n=1 Tax=Ensifer adhaerens TaxID=106592 RepID=UPI001CBEFE08|nr:anti-sigma factor [Ensifer adhaerens]MBZ7922379.1 anti-sigma factor [Ensifer adhaerens]UAX91012.1 anti-sigma factor [Ensifer adhaerens]UAX98641.1 anti-sigma factor [Ensifer adhaerens]UAY06022.1 anti-sigma factor [Ensifer adhaerens]
MTEDLNTVSEDDLHAYVDGFATPQERERIEQWLERNPARAEEVRQWQAQAVDLRSLFGGYARSDARDRALLSSSSNDPSQALPSKGTRSVTGRLRAIAAGLALFAAGGLTGLYAPSLLSADGADRSIETADSLPRQAQSAFLVYASEVRHAVEVGADDQSHLATWLGKRLDHPLTIPDLSSLGFSLVGGRLLPVNGKAGAMFMYEDGTGRRLTVLLGRNDDNRETSFRIDSSEGVETFYWIDGPIGYAVTGEVPRNLLQQVADECYRQFDKNEATGS